MDIQKSKQEDDILCIMCDFNEEIGIGQDLMATIYRNQNVYDVPLDMFPEDAETPTYNRGKKRLDYILYSQHETKPDRIGYIHTTTYITLITEQPSSTFL